MRFRRLRWCVKAPPGPLALGVFVELRHPFRLAAVVLLSLFLWVGSTLLFLDEGHGVAASLFFGYLLMGAITSLLFILGVLGEYLHDYLVARFRFLRSRPQ